ncbi:MAG TPA: TonB family protein, partial [Candidatus Acidoferrales bacterium]|nr:TonB family protein [Candidatus Acidoferrales bacterium]
GIEFVSLSDAARQQIRDWTDSANIRPGGPAGGLMPKLGREAAGSLARTDSRDAAAEFDLAFPSENPDEAEVRAGHGPTPRAIAPVEYESAPEHAQGPVNRGKSGAPSVDEREFREERVVPPPESPLGYGDADSNGNVRGNTLGNSNFGNPMFGNPMMLDRTPGPDPFAGMEYGAGGSEGWLRRSWLGVAMIVLVIFVAGGVLAVGPSNVKALLVQRLSADVNAPPPPQADAIENAPEQSESPSPAMPAAIPPAGNSELPADPSAAQSSAGAGMGVGNGIDASDPDAAAADAKSAHPAVERVPPPLTKANPVIHPSSSDDAKSAEEMTRRFQLEHRDAPMEATNRPVAKTNPAPVAQDTGVAGTGLERGLPPSSDERETRQSGQTSSTMPTGMPAGLVAVSSHFESTQGIAPDGLADNGTPTIGQLVSIKQPVYPAEAVREHVEGTVQLRVVVDQIGRVESVYVVSGPPLLVPAAIRAVREWRYNGTILNSKAVKSVENVAMVFRVANSLDSPQE